MKKNKKIFLHIIVFIFFAISCSDKTQKVEDKQKVFTDSIQIVNLDSCFMNLMNEDYVIDMNDFCIEYDSVEFVSPYISKEKIEDKVQKKLEVDWSEVPEEQYVLIFYHNENKVGIVSRSIIDVSSTLKNKILKNKRFSLKIAHDSVSSKIVFEAIE